MGSITTKPSELNGDKPPSLSSYAARAPVVTFHPGDLQLTAGPASERRTFLDRVAFYLRPEGAVDRARYAHALRSRQLLLRRGGSPTELAAFESLCARHGAALTTARRVATEAVQEHLGAAFASIADPALELRVAYAPGGSSDEDEAATRLLNNRAADAQRPSPAYGPHRDELDLRLSGRVARQVASQGQHRALTLALKAAEAAAVGAARGVEPILLLDDVSSELDAERSDALLRFLGAAHGQLFLTTTRPELFEASVLSRSETAHFLVEKGTFQRV